MQIIEATAPDAIADARRLFGEYAQALGVDLSYQGFAGELAGLPGAYAPPEGRLLLAQEGGVTAGCIALRPRGEGVCEMKRLYVRPAFRKGGCGRALCERLIAEARAAGYAAMVLDTLGFMRDAIRLYESLGFVRRTPYYDTPLQETVFMELRL